MTQNMISKGRLYITGLTGDGAKSDELWKEFDNLYTKNPFPKADEIRCEVRFYDGEKPAVRGQDVHVGYITENDAPVDGFTTLAIPLIDYAVLDTDLVKGSVSGNEAMTKWLAENSAQYKQLMIEGAVISMERYGGKSKGDRPDSIWIPVYGNCQSCGMPLVLEWLFGKDSTENIYGTEKDGSANRDYCYLCYVNGAFSTNYTMEEMIESCVPYTSNNNPWPDAETARSEMRKMYSKLKRWAK